MIELINTLLITILIYHFYDNPFIFYNLINGFILFSVLNYQVLERFVNRFLVDEYIKNDIYHPENLEYLDYYADDDFECIYEKITKDIPVNNEVEY